LKYFREKELNKPLSNYIKIMEFDWWGNVSIVNTGKWMG
jgi:hypothetical protein